MYIPVEWFESIYRMTRADVENNFELICDGISRAVYAINDNYIAKFAKCLDGGEQCRLEYRIYSHADRHLRKHLCPVVWYRSGLIIMLKAVPLTSVTNIPVVDIERMGLDRDAMKELRHVIKKYNLHYDDIKSTSSWGLIDNRPVLVEYGYAY